jgi:hypothetical protein
MLCSCEKIGKGQVKCRQGLLQFTCFASNHLCNIHPN